MQDDALPVGFRFYPTEEELVCYYLRRRYAEQRFPNVVGDLDIYEYEPWELHGKSPLKPRRNPETGKVAKEADFFFFTVSSNKYGNGPRKKRATYQGYWKATGRDREVTLEDTNSTAKKKIGMKKTLVFYKGRAPHGGRTDWILNEYRLDPGPEISKEYVINRVFNKRGDPKNQGLASDPLQAEEEEVAEEADTDSPNDRGHGANGGTGTGGDSVGQVAVDGKTRTSPEAVQWLGCEGKGDHVANQLFHGAGQEVGQQGEGGMYDAGSGAGGGMEEGWEKGGQGEDSLDWHMPEDFKMEDAQLDWGDLGLPHQPPSPLPTPASEAIPVKADGNLTGLADDFEAWYEARTAESECSLPWDFADGVCGQHTPGGGDMSWNDCLMMLEQNPCPAAAAQPFADPYPGMGHPTNPGFNMLMENTQTPYLSPPLVQECGSSTMADPFNLLSPARIQIRARPVGWGAGPLMGSGGVARRVRMAVRPGGVGKGLGGAGMVESMGDVGVEGIEGVSEMSGAIKSPVGVVEGKVVGNMPRRSQMSRRATDPALILMTVRQRVGHAGNGTGWQGYKNECKDKSSALVPVVECDVRVAKSGNAAKVQPGNSAEEDLHARRIQISCADLGGRGGSESDSSTPCGDGIHDREGQTSRPALEKGVADSESGSEGSGVGNGVRNQNVVGRFQERARGGERNCGSHVCLLSQDRPLRSSRRFFLGLMGGVVGVLAIFVAVCEVGNIDSVVSGSSNRSE